MSFRTKLLLIAVLPLIAVAASMAFVINYQFGQLHHTQSEAMETKFIEAKRAELKAHVEMAYTAIEKIYEEEPGGEEVAQQLAKNILSTLTFGDDGYFYAYDRTGVNLVHPIEPHLEGQNLWTTRDRTGNYVIQNLMWKAKSGGGFHQYVWNKPTTGQQAEKLGYAVFLDKWNWMFGSGLYIDDINLELAALRERIADNQQETATTLFLITVLAVLLVAISILFISLNEQKMADVRLKALTKRIVDVQEQERKRVSSELHDGISQLLVSARYGLEAAMVRAKKVPEIQGVIGKSVSILENAIGEVRRISMDLRPSILDDMGLASAIRSLARSFEERSGIRVETDVERTQQIVSEEAKTALYRVAQEALTNVAKHSNASEVEISLKRRGRNLVMIIADNGDGIDAESHRTSDEEERTGLGVRNMRERMESHGGSMLIDSQSQGEQSGTRIIVRIPVLRESQRAA